MADLIIKGMKMPKDRPVSVFIWPDGRVFPNGLYKSEEWDGVKAIPLPEGHGRLIDADALLDEFTRSAKEGRFKPFSGVKNAATIVPAKGGTGDEQ